MYLSWIHISFCFFVFSYICRNPAISTSSDTTVSYTDHCSSIVPEPIPTVRTNRDSIPYIFRYYFTGGDRILSLKPFKVNYNYVEKSLRIRILPNYYETTATCVYKVTGFLYIRFPFTDVVDDGDDEDSRSNHKSRSRGSIRFLLNGFWSEISSKLCMVGSASWEVESGNVITLDAALKLNCASENPTLHTSVVSGTLESTVSANDPSYFDPVLMFGFPELSNYIYSLASEELGGVFPTDYDVPKNQSLSLRPAIFCSLFGWDMLRLELEYTTECREPQQCSPLGVSDGGLVGFLPPFLSLSRIQCLEGERKLRFIATFQNSSYDDQSFGSMLIGEALWDDSLNQLFGVACRLLDPSRHFGNGVGDCAIRMTLRCPSIQTIRKIPNIVGQFWSTKTVDDSSYFRKIKVTSDQITIPLSGLKYEYTELDRVRELCSERKLVKKGATYPAANHNIGFGMAIIDSKGQQCQWCNAAPLSVGNMIYDMYTMAPDSALGEAPKSEIRSKSTPTDISFRINFDPYCQVNLSEWFPSSKQSVFPAGNPNEIAAEGVYDAETGFLCMVGCRELAQNSTYDCEILIKVQFAPVGENEGAYAKGTIESMRATTDPLYFQDLSMLSSNFPRQLIQRMDLEMIMSLISNTLSCMFAAMQIIHVKKNPEVRSCISLVMLVVLSLGHMILLVFNTEAAFWGKRDEQTSQLSTADGRLQTNQVTALLMSIVEFLLQMRLLQLVWNAKKNREDNEKKPWIGEMAVAIFTVALYILGGMLILLLNWKRNPSLWGNLRSFPGLILDGFLLPQILLNAFMGSAEKALSPTFYIGISTVRLLPHAYNQYRKHKHPMYDLVETYYYANPLAEFYSTAWDIIIPCGVVALAAVVFLQQRHGGRFKLPQRFRSSEFYEKVPTAENE